MIPSSAPRPARLIPWQADVMEACCDALLAEAVPLHEQLALFPHRRPRRYLLRALAQRRKRAGDARPFRPPRVMAASECIGWLRGQLPGPAKVTVGALDRVHLLQEIVARLQRQRRDAGRGMLADLAAIDAETFFPWGVRLESLLEECFLAAVDPPPSLANLEGEVDPFAAALLEELAAIHAAYLTALDRHGWTTPGLDALEVARRAEEALECIPETVIHLVGFDDRSGAEDLLFRTMWRSGRAGLLFHGDPAVARDRQDDHDEEPRGAGPHWSQAGIAQWLKDWGLRPHADLQVLDSPPAHAARGETRYHEGHDLHSQLAVLETNLRLDLDLHGSLDGVAIVITEPAMLLPVLRHLPEVDVNVSLGFPLRRSGLAQLLEHCLALQERSPGPGVHHWRDILALLRHPALALVKTADGPSIRPALHALEHVLRQGPPHVRTREWIGQALRHQDAPDQPPRFSPVELEQLEPLLRTVFAALTDAWQDAATLAGLAAALEGVCRLLLEHGGETWKRLPLDGECLHRLLHHVLPTLSGCTLRDEPLSRDLLFAILREVLDGERAPFEAEPLTGLQVLGLLEARLLSFRHLHVVGATDDRLPGRPAADPLLPDSLRPALGLPDGWRRERRQAAVFFRSLQAAGQADVYTQTGVTSRGLLEDKKLRSRFVEEAIWRREQALGRLLEPGEPPLRRIHFPARSLPRVRRGLPVTPAARHLLDARLTRPLSPSFLDAWLQCPARCFVEHILGLRPRDEVLEEGDPAALGEIVHDVLEKAIAPRKGRRLAPDVLDAAALGQAYADALHASELAKRTRFDVLLAMELAGRKRLGEYVAAMPETYVEALEDRLEGDLDVDGQTVLFRGRRDRLDLREGGLLILDYKTGHCRLPKPSFWQDGDHWPDMEAWPDPLAGSADDAGAALLLGRLAEELKSVQLPLYLHCQLCTHPETAAGLDAALISLRDGGRELPLLGPDMDDATRQDVLTRRIPIVLRFLARHLRRCTTLPALEGGGCAHCALGEGCISSVTA